MNSIAVERPNFMLLATSIFLLAAAQFVAFAPFAAQNLTDEQQTLISLYDALLDNPTDTKLTLEYAAHAVKIGDYEAAIPPLERILLTNPNATRVMFELGTLYYLLGAYDIARDYFTDVKTQASAEDELVGMAESYLKRM